MYTPIVLNSVKVELSEIIVYTYVSSMVVYANATVIIFVEFEIQICALKLKSLNATV